MTRRVLAAAALLAAGPLLAGCSGETADLAPAELSSADAAEVTGPPVGPQYVALGDSYAAAPGVPETFGADGCFRSSGNYATTLAVRTGLTVTDVTCSGATSESVLQDQVPSITAEAELVTVGVGGNDFDLFAQLIQGCVDAATADPTGSPCSDEIGADAVGVLPQIGLNVGGVLDAIVAAAPEARVVVVGYPVLLPDTGTCPERMPLAAGDYALVNEVTRGLNAALQEQAEQRDLDFLDLARPSRGHDVCADEPWINGVQVGEDGTIPFHPFAVEQRAVADMIARFL